MIKKKVAKKAKTSSSKHVLKPRAKVAKKANPITQTKVGSKRETKVKTESVIKASLLGESSFLPPKLKGGQKRKLGYFFGGLVVIVSGFLLFTQNEVREGSALSAAPLPMATAQVVIAGPSVSSEAAPETKGTIQETSVPTGETKQVVAANQVTAPVTAPVIVPVVVKETSDPPISKADPGLLASEFSLTLPMSLSERINYWSSYISESQAHQSKIRELAKGFSSEDNEPIVPHLYDCTTYVETVAALSLSNASNQFLSKLISIRYKDGVANFYTRNHFPEIDWIPNNQRAGNLNDITRTFAESQKLTLNFSQKLIDRGRWLSEKATNEKIPIRRITSLSQDADRPLPESPVPASVPYISIQQFKKALAGLPSGVVINFVHENNAKKPTLITHQAFFIRKGTQSYLRHASEGGKIREIKVTTYLARLMRSKGHWPVVGVNLNQFIDSSSSTKRFSETM